MELPYSCWDPAALDPVCSPFLIASLPAFSSEEESFPTCLVSVFMWITSFRCHQLPCVLLDNHPSSQSDKTCG